MPQWHNWGLKKRLLAGSASHLSPTGFWRCCHWTYTPVAPIRLFGAGGRNRTPDLLITSQSLYLLSYTSVAVEEWIEHSQCGSKPHALPLGYSTIILLVGATGFEPATSCSQSKRSTKLSHTPILAINSWYNWLLWNKSMFPTISYNIIGDFIFVYYLPAICYAPNNSNLLRLIKSESDSITNCEKRQIH